MRKLWLNRTSGVMVLLAGLLLMITSASRAEVRDDGHFFSAAAVDQANRDTDQIQDKYHKQIVIETFAGIPADMRSDYSDANKQSFFEHWADQRFKRNNVNGIYVLLCKDPPYLKPLVGHDTGVGFTLNDSQTLGEKMRTQLHNKQPDAALTDGISYIRATLAGVNPNARAATPAASPTNTSPGGTPSYGPANSPGNSGTGNVPPIYSSTGHGMGIFGWIILIGVVFVVIRVLRRLFSGMRNTGGGQMNSGPMGGGGMMGGGSGYGGGYGGSSGGGFGRGLLGGLLGGVASSWLYNREENRGNSGGGIFGGGGNNDSGSGGSFGGGDTFGGNDAGVPMSGDSGGGSFGDSGGGGGGGGDSTGGGSF